MKKLSLICYLLFGMGTFSIAQDADPNIASKSFENLWESDGNSVFIFNKSYDGIHGTPYLHKDWYKGGIEMRAGNWFKDMWLKYDMKEDNVLIKDNSGRSIFPNHGSVRSFYYLDENGNRHVFENLQLKLKNDMPALRGFSELLYEGKARLYVKRKKYLKHIDSKGAYSSNKSYDEFRALPPEFILIDAANDVIRFEPGKKPVLKALGDSPELASYVKKNKLNLKKDEDIIALVAYYDSL